MSAESEKNQEAAVSNRNEDWNIGKSFRYMAVWLATSIVIVIVYLLSFGFYLRFGGTQTTPTMRTYNSPILHTIYSPAMRWINGQITPMPEGGAVNLYRRYLQWCDEL